MSEDKRIQYIIEAIDESEEGLKSASNNVKNMAKETVSLQNASDARIRNAIADLRKERSEIVENTTSITKNTAAHVRNETVARANLSSQFNYSRRLTGQFNELATRILGIGGAYATFRYLTNAVKDAGLDTTTLDKNIKSLSATIGTELLPTVEGGMKWFNDNLPEITRGILAFGRIVAAPFQTLANIPIGIMAAWYKVVPWIDKVLGVNGPVAEKHIKEAETYGKSWGESFMKGFDDIGEMIGKIGDLPEMKKPKTKDEGPKGSGLLKWKADIDEQSFKDAKNRWKAVQEWKETIDNESFASAQKHFELMEKLREESKEVEIASIQDQYARENAELEYWKQNEIEMYGYYGEQKLLIDTMYDAKKKEIEDNAAKRTKELVDKERVMKLNSFYQVADGFSNLMAAIGDATKENANAQKAIAIVQAVINTAVGVTKAFAQGGTLGFVTGALVAAAGAVQIATIASQKFALGGIARREPGAVSDSVNIAVNPNERIVTRRQENNLTRFLNNPDNQGRGDTFNIYDYSGDLVETFVSKVRNGQGESFKSLLQSRYIMA